MKYNQNDLREKVKDYGSWYHKIDLGQGIVTPGLDFEPIWDMVRSSRNHIDYKGKTVLDLASFDGMWAFEAEKLGAEIVVATDVYYENFKKFLFCREVLDSKVIPYYNVSPYDLWNRLDVFLQENWDSQKPYERLFDVVQHLGLLYHLRDPMLTLSQSRSMMRPGGYMLIETAVVLDGNKNESFMLFNGVPPEEQRIYRDTTTWWAPTIRCLKEMLKASLFEPIEESLNILHSSNVEGKLKQYLLKLFRGRYEIARASLVCRAITSKEIDSEYFRELARTYRNPGLVVEHMQD